MSTMIGCEQFIYGKFEREGGYRIVAHTAGLAGQNDLLHRLEQAYRFWSASPPARGARAVGCVWTEDRLILIQVMPALDPQGHEVVDAFDRVFMQRRYVFVPTTVGALVHGRLWLLLNWLAGQPIPLCNAFEGNLAQLRVPEAVLRPAGSGEEDAKKVWQSLGLPPTGDQPTLLAALACLLGGTRLIVDPTMGYNVSSPTLLESLLLLLPPASRQRVAIALGDLEEEACQWANVIVKANKRPSLPLPPTMVWLDRGANEFVGQTSEARFQHRATTILQPLVAHQEILPQLLSGVEAFEGDLPFDSLPPPEVVAPLIPLLPTRETRDHVWAALLAAMAPPAQVALLLAQQDSEALWRAWGLLKQMSAANTRPPTEAIVQVWNRLPPADLVRVFRGELMGAGAWAERLLCALPLDQISALADIQVRAALHELCLALIIQAGAQVPNDAEQLAVYFVGAYPDWSSEERFHLWGATLAPHRQPVLQGRALEEMVRLLPRVSTKTATESGLAKQWHQWHPEAYQLLEAIALGPAPGLPCVALFARVLGMSLAQRAAFYAAVLDAWKPPFAATRGMLADLLGLSLKPQPQNGKVPHPWLWQEALGPTQPWFQAAMPPQLGALLDKAQQSTIPLWAPWHAVAMALYEQPVDQVGFLDPLMADGHLAEVVAAWLEALGPALSEAHLQRFTTSHTWTVLQHQRHAPLREAVAWVLGITPASDPGRYAAHFQTLRGLPALPRTTLLALIEHIPQRQAGVVLDERHLIEFLALFLVDPNDMARLGESGLWQPLERLAPRLARLVRAVALGQAHQEDIARGVQVAPDHAPIIAAWLQHLGHADWIRGVLLHLLATGWIEQGQANAPLLALLVASVGKGGATGEDWLQVVRLSWLPDAAHLGPVGGMPLLGEDEKRLLGAYGCEQIRHSQMPEAVGRLIGHCRSYGLSAEALATLLVAAPPDACDSTLVRERLAALDGGGDAALRSSLVQRALQLPTHHADEQTQVQMLLAEAFMAVLRPDHEISTQVVQQWRQHASDKALYLRALSNATRSLADPHFHHLLGWAQALSRDALYEESDAIFAALKGYMNTLEAQLNATRPSSMARGARGL